jgi:hypothetical protein
VYNSLISRPELNSALKALLNLLPSLFSSKDSEFLLQSTLICSSDSETLELMKFIDDMNIIDELNFVPGFHSLFFQSIFKAKESSTETMVHMFFFEE